MSARFLAGQIEQPALCLYPKHNLFAPYSEVILRWRLV
jgi:hypothetical protein